MKQFFKFMFASCLGTASVLVVLFLLAMGFMGAFFSGLTKDKVAVVKENSVLELNLGRSIYEREPSEFDAFFSGSAGIGLNTLLKSIKLAKTDPKIQGIYIKGTSVGGGWATLEEIRNALIDFKKSGKFIVAYSDSYSQKLYYLSTIADKIYLHPSGFVQLTGLSAETMFYKDLLKKLDIQVELLRPKSNNYKSAGEMFILDKMSEANRQQIKEYLSSIWEHVLGNIVESRNLSQEKLSSQIDNLEVFLAEGALKNQLVDGNVFETEVLTEIQKLVKEDKFKDVKFISISKYSKSNPVKKQESDKIAIIYAQGDVVSGKGIDTKVYSDVIVKALRNAADDDKVKAIILRVNSPGGNAVASESMTNEMFLTAMKKPVIASFGDVAASAGYEMSCGATKIVAQPNTITGSIGVFGVIPNFGPLFKNKLGLTFDTVNTNKNAAMISIYRPLSPQSKALLVQNVENFYKTFCQRVATGRKLTVEYVDSIARGRVWAGVDAKRIGLVDELGGIDKAIEIAAKEAKITKYSIVEFPKQKDSYTQLMDFLNIEARSKYIPTNMGEFGKIYKELKTITEMDELQARLPYYIEIN